MKTLSFLLLAACSYCLNAQEVQRQAPKSTPEKTHPLTVPLRLKRAGPEQVFYYSGFFVDLSRAEHPIRLLSLRSPLDPKRDGENLIRPPVSNRPVGFKLFSVDF